MSIWKLRSLMIWRSSYWQFDHDVWCHTGKTFQFLVYIFLPKLSLLSKLGKNIFFLLEGVYKYVADDTWWIKKYCWWPKKGINICTAPLVKEGNYILLASSGSVLDYKTSEVALQQGRQFGKNLHNLFIYLKRNLIMIGTQLAFIAVLKLGLLLLCCYSLLNKFRGGVCPSHCRSPFN